ncbi:hypothetical protein EV694_0993 [Volucribacter psittacicida]|uniref:Uncharacterized protein n=1 Tax=Volucribacter psittacicida TaxID=203482 RepID=A0A4R1FXQ6_9PAST|nr:hypothetical protein [Volucribacter psittacicida]TCJ98582.1 hypothetical protein EV694_0993 [Volucribacter psittacicida]
MAVRRKKIFLKQKTSFRISQNRALRLKRLRQRKKMVSSRHSLQFMLQQDA